MKFQSVVILLISLFLFSCQDENKIRFIEQQKEAKKKRSHFQQHQQSLGFQYSAFGPNRSRKNQ